MTETKTIDLIRGVFSHSEAKEILLDIIRSKINFHNMRNWSSEERFSKPDAFSKERLAELQLTRELLKTYFNEACSLDKKIRIKCQIEMNLE